MESLRDFMASRHFEDMPKYKDVLGGYVTEYYTHTDRVAVVEDVDKIQVMTYYKDRFKHTEVKTLAEALEFLKEVIV